MKVITAYPVYVNKNRVAGEQDWLYVDGKSSSSVILAFQKYANAKGWSPKLTEDGKWGPKTQSAAATWGAAFDKDTAASSSTVANVATGGSVPYVAPGATPTTAQIEEAKKKGLTWDKLQGAFVKAKESGFLDTVLGLFGKGTSSQGTAPAASEIPQAGVTPSGTPEYGKPGMSKTMKIALIGGGVVLVGVLIFALTRNKGGEK